MIGVSSNAAGGSIDKSESHRLSFLNLKKLNQEVDVPPKLYEAVFSMIYKEHVILPEVAFVKCIETE